MALKTIPTNIGGVQLPFNQLEGPLASLFTTDQAQNLTYPADLASNPMMCHAVQFSVHDWTTEFAGMVNTGLTTLANGLSNASVSKTVNAFKDAAANPMGTLEKLGGDNTLPNMAKLVQAQTYKQKLSNPLAHINLYMPDTLVNSFSSTYDEIELTQKLGLPGVAVQSAADLMGGSLGSTNKDVIGNVVNAFKNATPGSVANVLQSKTAQGIAGLVGGDLMQSAFGVAVNPQVQLLYKGIGLRTFLLEFMFTPKDAREAQATKNIVDAFNYFSLPSLAGKSGQFLVAPQIFKIKFSFTGGNALTTAFQQAFSSIGLGFLNTSNQTETIRSAPDAKVYTISHPCVLADVNVDYAPNGWAAYNDGHPIQTRLTLTFKETQIVTKESYGKNMNQNWLGEVQNQMNMNKPYLTESAAENWYQNTQTPNFYEPWKNNE